MRVLVLALLAGCYDPAIEDCQFRCGAQMDCPDGTLCSGQFCRTAGATGQCTIPDPCPAIDPPSGCSSPVKFALDAGGCAVLCSNKIESGELTRECTGVWKPGRLDSIAELEAAPIVDHTWVGALRASGNFTWTGYGDPVTGPVWDTSQPQANGEDCAYFDRPRLRLRNDRTCTGDSPYICTTP